MRALVASPLGREHVELREVSDPIPSSNDNLVEVRSISINRGEVNRLASAEDGASLGWDLAGVIRQSASNGQGPPVGTRVAGFVLNAAWAELAAVPSNRLGLLPDETSFAAACTLPVAGLTALRMLRLGGLLLGKRVMITGASGGVGRFAVQLAARAGAHVTGVVGSLDRGQGLKEVGADELVVDLSSLSPTYDLILESAGGPSLAQALRLVGSGGTVVTFGNSSMKETTVNISLFYGRNGPRMIGFSLLAASQPQDFGADIGYLAGLLASRDLDPQIDFEGSWEQAADALQALGERRVRGKAILTVA